MTQGQFPALLFCFCLWHVLGNIEMPRMGLKMWLINLISNLELTIAAAKVESNIHTHGSSSLIWYATGVDSLFIAAKATNAPDLDSSRTIAEGEERVTV